MDGIDGRGMPPGRRPEADPDGRTRESRQFEQDAMRDYEQNGSKYQSDDDFFRKWKQRAQDYGLDDDDSDNVLDTVLSGDRGGQGNWPTAKKPGYRTGGRF
jgi:hypothetical protein